MMRTESEKNKVIPNHTLLREVERASGESISSCYQCKKCSSGCPVAFAMDIVPHRIMHMIHLGMKDDVLGSHTIWLCASCETCSARCPNDIAIAKVMDALRQKCIKENYKPKEEQIPQFHDVFLKSFKGRGRVYELEMIGRYKMKTGEYAKDMKLGWEMFKKGKMKLIPHGISGRNEVKEIFKRVEEKV